MRQTWNKLETSSTGEGQPAPQSFILFPESYRQKMLSKASRRAIDNYNNMSTENDKHNYDNMSFIPESGDDLNSNFSTMSSTKPLNAVAPRNTINNFSHIPPRTGHIYTSDDLYDYPTLRSSSQGTMTMTESETDGERREELRTTSKFVRLKIRDSFNTCLGYVETVLCTISLACGLGNIYRLPQAVLGGGGLPFLIAYIILAILIGLPLLILEIGLGQIVQEGFTKTWRAVPFFRGVAYVKLLAGCLLSIYYPLYMGLSVLYIMWFSKEKLPFSECATIRMQESGYKASGIPGQTCIQKTFLESPFNGPKMFGIFAALLFLIWIITLIGLIRKTKSYIAALIIYLLLTIACLIAVIVKAIEYEGDFVGLEKFSENIDWKILGTANVWYYAAIQVFFSTNIGFGTFVTNAGTIFKKVNPVWTALGFTLANLIIGIVVVLLCYILSQNVDPIPNSQSNTQVHLLTLIYDISLSNASKIHIAWPIIAFCCILFSGFISMTTIIYTVLKAINMEFNSRWYWWQMSIFLGFFGFLLSAAILLYEKLKIAHMFDHYVVGNLILLTVVIEVFGFICIYGVKRLQSDFEFILGRRLSVIWICLWWMSPIALIAIFIWGLSTLSNTGYLGLDPVWIYATGWSILLLSIIFIILMGFYHVSKQDEYYTFNDRMKAALKPLRKWGPKDPIMRYNWVQYQSNAQDGKKDFTLRRRGTKDYAHSVKNRTKYNPRRYTPTESSTKTASVAYRENDQNQNNITLTHIHSYDEAYHTPNEFKTIHLPTIDRPLRVTSLVDTLDPPINNAYVNRSTYPDGGEFKLSLNPLSNMNNYTNDPRTDSAASEGYGTFRKGPFVIQGDDGAHVCHRRNSAYSEDATEL